MRNRIIHVCLAVTALANFAPIGLPPVDISSKQTTLQYACFVDQETSGTQGGTATSGAWRTRVLNTTVANTITSATLSSNQISLPAGTYIVRASAPAAFVNNHQIRWQNITDSTATIIGTSMHAGSGSSIYNEAALFGQFTISGTKTFELQHQVFSTQSANGFGIATTFGSEYYARVELWKLN